MVCNGRPIAQEVAFPRITRVVVRLREEAALVQPRLLELVDPVLGLPGPKARHLDTRSIGTTVRRHDGAILSELPVSPHLDTKTFDVEVPDTKPAAGKFCGCRIKPPTQPVR